MKNERKVTDKPSLSQPALSFTNAFIKRNGHLCCLKCLRPIDELPHICTEAKPWAAR